MSEYPPDHIAYSTENKKVKGKLKEEYHSTPIRCFTALRPKMYCVEANLVSPKKRAKGIKRSVLEREITPQQYKECLFFNKDFTHTQNMITRKKHVLYTSKMVKKSLSSYDNKRLFLRDNIYSIPYYHSDWKKYNDKLQNVHKELLSVMVDKKCAELMRSVQWNVEKLLIIK